MNPNPSPTTRWQKGQSGNPSGRPKGFGYLVRKLVDPKEIIDFSLAVMRNEGAKTKDRIDAAKFLTEHGWGKPLTTIAVEADIRAETRKMAASIDTEQLSDEQLAELEHLLEECSISPGNDDDGW